MPLVYIIVLNYRNYIDTIRCVRGIEAMQYSDYCVVVVDNHSDNESEAVLRKELAEYRIIQTGRNGGYAQGNNIGIRMALEEGADYVLILNNDTRIEPDFLSILVSYAEADPTAGVLGPMIVTEDGLIDHTCARRRPALGDYFWRLGPGRWFAPKNRWVRAHYYENDYDFGDSATVDIISGSCMLMRTDMLREIGLLDEKTFLYFEESILHEKLRDTRYRTVIVASSRIVHRKGQSTSTIPVYANVIAFLGSLNYYLKSYRHVGAIMRALMLVSVALYRTPGVIKGLLQPLLPRPRENQSVS
jgi:GT2 family glycosyltransferase